MSTSGKHARTIKLCWWNINPEVQVPNLSNKTTRNDGFVSLMVREAIESSRDFNPDSKLLARIGEMLPHLEPYAGESDLETFEIFIVGIL